MTIFIKPYPSQGARPMDGTYTISPLTEEHEKYGFKVRRYEIVIDGGRLHPDREAKLKLDENDLVQLHKKLTEALLQAQAGK